MRLLEQAKVPHTYQPGEILFYEGNPCLGLFCLQQGTVALRRAGASGSSPIVRLVEAGQTLGYRAYFSSGRYTASAQAATECQVCFVEKSAVEQLLVQNHALGQQFLLRMAGDLARAETALVQATTLSVRARLSFLLLSLKADHGQVDAGGNLVIEVPLSRQDLASMVGTRPETLSRAIRSLESAGVASFSARTVVVPDLDALIDEVEAR